MPIDQSPKASLESLEGIDKLIHEPARLHIMTGLYVLEGADMVFLRKQTGLTWGNLSVHVSRLAEAGYVKTQKEFVENKPHTVVSLTDSGRRAFEEYREKMKNLLA